MPPSLPRNTPTPFLFLSLSPRQTGVMEKKTDGGSSKHEPVFTMSVESKCCVCFYKASSKQDDVCAMSVETKCCVCFFFKPRASKMTSVSCRLRQSVVSFFFNPWASKIASVSCRLLPSCLLYASHRKNVDPSRKHEPVFTISVESKWRVCFFFFTPRASKIPSVSCRLSQNVVSVFFLSLVQAGSLLCHDGRVKMLCLFFLSLGQAGSLLCHDGRVKMLCLFFFKSPASKITSVSCRLSQNAVSVFLLPLGKQDRTCAMSAHRAPLILLAPRISRTNVDPSSKRGPVCAMSVASKWCVLFP